MIVTRELRRQVAGQASAVQLWLYGSDEAAEKLDQISQKYDLTNAAIKSKFVVTVANTILGFYRVPDTVPLLQQELGLSPRTAAILGADVLDFLAPLSDPNWHPPQPEIIEEEISIPEQIPVPIPTLSTEPYHQILESLPTAPLMTPNYIAPAAPSPTTPQSSSLHFEPVHTSVGQDALRQPLSQIPSYNNQPATNTPPADIETPPQWGRY